MPAASDAPAQGSMSEKSKTDKRGHKSKGTHPAARGKKAMKAIYSGKKEKKKRTTLAEAWCSITEKRKEEQSTASRKKTLMVGLEL